MDNSLNTLVACTSCGDNDFYQADGHYFCIECNTKTQTDQTIWINQNCLERINEKSTKRSKKKGEKVEIVDSLTTWECYNYILRGWVNRLIELGASEDLKEITQLLYFKYLNNIEVIHKNPKQYPRLPANNFEKDAEIIYGVSLVKDKDKVKYKQQYDKITADDLPLMEPHRKRKNQTRLLNEALLKLHTVPATKQIDLDQSLGNISSCSSTEKLKFTKKAKLEFKNNETTISKKYRQFEDELLSRHKALSILYLALIIVKEDIQLGDLMRLIKFGDLVVTNYHTLIPEKYDASCINDEFHDKFYQPHHVYRFHAGKMMDLLKIRDIIPTQDIVSLCKRYCFELNLPVEIENYVLNLISRTKPRFKIGIYLPNYEGRCMSFIIFALKIFFSLDGITEHKLSKFSDTVPTKNMFNFNDWLHYIIYRRLVIEEYHYPTQFENKNHPLYSELYVDFKNKLLREELSDESYKDLNLFLDKLPDDQRSAHIDFKHSLTPQSDFLRQLIDKKIINMDCGYLNKHIFKDFRNTSLDYLVHYQKYFNKEVKIVHHGANAEFEWTDITDESYQSYPTVLCNIVESTDTEIINNKHNMDEITTSSNKSGESTNQISANLQDTNDALEYRFHYLPDEMFWLCHATSRNEANYKYYKKHVTKLPETFKIVIQECGKIISHEPKEMLEEYMQLETYMCHHFQKKWACDNTMEKLIKRSVKLW